MRTKVGWYRFTDTHHSILRRGYIGSVFSLILSLGIAFFLSFFTSTIISVSVSLYVHIFWELSKVYVLRCWHGGYPILEKKCDLYDEITNRVIEYHREKGESGW